MPKTTNSTSTPSLFDRLTVQEIIPTVRLESLNLSQDRRPSTAYQIHLAAAMVGLTTLAIGLDGEVRIRMGLDGSEAFRRDGLPVFILSLSWAYLFRLIFWNWVSPQIQQAVRNVLSLLIAIELPMAITTISLIATQPTSNSENEVGASIFLTFMSIIGTLCQISTVIWLLRYRKE